MLVDRGGPGTAHENPSRPGEIRATGAIQGRKEKKKSGLRHVFGSLYDIRFIRTRIQVFPNADPAPDPGKKSSVSKALK